ncbi:MAG: VOC family protein [Proteobacteria bacterium]|nr:VOC family protein [Pseudomonadota bacterium]
MSVPFRLRQLDHVVLRVRDVAAMRRFYCVVLGCTPELDQAGIGLYQLRAGESLIDLVDVHGKLGRQGGAAPGAEARNMDHFCLAVDGYDEAAITAHLKSHGVRVGETGMRYGAEGEGPSLYVFDPEGNVVELKGPPVPGSRVGLPS